MTKSKYSAGWIITYAALGINLFLGLLYAWGVFQKALVTEWGWSNTTASLPYTVSAAIFAFMMIFAGRAQDKYGPRIIVIIGGLIFGTGLILSGFATNPVMMILTFGVMGGIGIGVGYSATTPCAIKWFDPSKKGLISGIVVSGVGLAPVYIAPLTAWLLKLYGIRETFIILGILAIVVISLLSFILRNPPVGYTPATSVNTTKQNNSSVQNFTWSEILCKRSFYFLWTIYLLSATAGLMLIAHIASIAQTQAGWKAGFVLVVILSLFNALGRVIMGFLSDRIGRKASLLLVFLLQAVNMFIFTFYNSVPLLIAGAAVAGLSYGSLFALFPAATADYFGLKNLGVNYGLVFTGWGIAGVIGPLLAGLVVDKTGTYTISYLVSAILLIVGSVMVLFMKSK